MTNSPMRLTAAVLVALTLVIIGLGLVNAHRAAPAPIMIETPAGGTAAPVPFDAAPVTANAAPTAPAPAPASALAAAVPAVDTTKAVPKVQALIYVHVAGAVKHPSLYQLAPNSRVWHAIKAAGGPTGNADEDAVNLAAKLTDGEKVFVPAKAAAHAQPAPPEAVPAPVAGAVMARAARAPTAAKSKVGAAAGAAGKPTKLVSPAQGQVNLNTAGLEQLQELPGIGPAMAGRIVAYRQQSGGFQKAEDLMNVGGIGPKKFARIAPLVKLH